jgi:hypothetical protein
MTSLGRVVEAWSYTLSSLGGERVDSMDVTPAGVADTRRYVVIDASAPAPRQPAVSPDGPDRDDR